MQHVNDDMDDVFKKAGEAYPLGTGTPDWAKVQHALNAQKEPEPARKKNNNYLWLLCLIPFMLICNRYAGTDKNSVGTTASQTAKWNKEKADQKPDGQSSNAIRNPKALSQNNGEIVTTKPAATKINFGTAQQHKSTPENQTTAKTTKRSLAFQHTKQQHDVGNELVVVAQKNAGQNEPVPARAAAQRTVATVSRLDAGGEEPVRGLRTNFFLDSISNAIAASPVLHPKAGATETTKSTLHYKKGLYAGIMGSADLTTVRLQKTANLGWQYGILAGYAFHKKWSIEAGMFVDRKFYFSKGAYLDKSRTYLPPNSDITEVLGNCTMLEFPLSIKYNLTSGKRSQFFATGGISSYVMKKEDYAYTYYYRGSGSYAIHDKSYRNASTNLFSVLQLSGGYAHSLGRSTSLRIEPYLKLPLAGLGYGKLHFTSFGLSAGVVKSFRR